MYYFGKTVVSTLFIGINLEIKAQLQTMVNCGKWLYKYTIFNAFLNI